MDDLLFWSGVGLVIVLIGIIPVVGVVMLKRSEDKALRRIGIGLVIVYGGLGLVYVAMLLLTMPVGSDDEEDTFALTCSDFPSQTAAQIFYDQLRQEGSSGWEQITVDERGVACEGGTFLDTSQYSLRVGDVLFVYERAPR